ncbi:MAG: cytochrome P450 [Ilumatobacteraceae bacterium]|nr:cytochrome P450 [Ilumatobacteraceae bacterium]
MGTHFFDRSWYDQPHDVFARLRATEPVARDADTNTYALLMHADIIWAERQPTLFSSANGSRPNGEQQYSMIDTDDPKHGEQRRLVAKGFTPKQMARYEQHVRDVLESLIDAAIKARTFDVVTAIARPLPMTLIGEMLGIAPSDYELLQHWSDQMIQGADGPQNITDEVINAAVAWYMYFGDLAATRSASPSDDLISVLIGAHNEDGLLSFDEAQGNALLLLVGGNETTRNVISGGLQALLADRTQWDAIVADPALIPSAVEECLRWVTPIVSMSRVTTRDIDIRGVTIPEGYQVLMMYPSANRDETVFTDPMTFDIHRNPNPHLAFGFGPHFCLGSSLARLEIRVVLEELVKRAPQLRIADDSAPPKYKGSSFVRGITELVVTV